MVYYRLEVIGRKASINKIKDKRLILFVEVSDRLVGYCE